MCATINDRKFGCCENCDAVGTTKLCSSCRLAQYCSVNCQRAAWPKHKVRCGDLKLHFDNHRKLSTLIEEHWEQVIMYTAILWSRFSEKMVPGQFEYPIMVSSTGIALNSEPFSALKMATFNEYTQTSDTQSRREDGDTPRIWISFVLSKDNQPTMINGNDATSLTVIQNGFALSNIKMTCSVFEMLLPDDIQARNATLDSMLEQYGKW